MKVIASLSISYVLWLTINCLDTQIMYNNNKKPKLSASNGVGNEIDTQSQMTNPNLLQEISANVH